MAYGCVRGPIAHATESLGGLWLCARTHSARYCEPRWIMVVGAATEHTPASETQAAAATCGGCRDVAVVAAAI